MKKICCMYGSWINNNTDRTLDVVFSRVRVLRLQKPRSSSPKELHVCRVELHYRERSCFLNCPPPTLTQIRKKTAQPGSPGKVKHSILRLITIQIEH